MNSFASENVISFQSLDLERTGIKLIRHQLFIILLKLSLLLCFNVTIDQRTYSVTLERQHSLTDQFRILKPIHNVWFRYSDIWSFIFGWLLSDVSKALSPFETSGCTHPKTWRHNPWHKNIWLQKLFRILNHLGEDWVTENLTDDRF